MPRQFSFPGVGVNLLNQFQQIFILLSRREAGQASRNNLIVTPLVPGGSPRHQSCRRRVHGPAGRSGWENIFSREVGGRALENLHLKL
jgi:hypothetical protein